MAKTSSKGKFRSAQAAVRENARLKPCPFCLGKAAYHHNMVECIQCGAKMPGTEHEGFRDLGRRLMLRWNRRPITVAAVVKRSRAAAATARLKQELENALIRERSMVAEMDAMRAREASRGTAKRPMTDQDREVMIRRALKRMASEAAQKK